MDSSFWLLNILKDEWSIKLMVKADSTFKN